MLWVDHATSRDITTSIPEVYEIYICDIVCIYMYVYDENC